MEKHKLQHGNGLVSVSTLCYEASEIKIALKNNLGFNHNRLNVDTNDIVGKEGGVVCSLHIREVQRLLYF